MQEKLKTRKNSEHATKPPKIKLNNAKEISLKNTEKNGQSPEKLEKNLTQNQKCRKEGGKIILKN